MSTELRIKNKTRSKMPKKYCLWKVLFILINWITFSKSHGVTFIFQVAQPFLALNLDLWSSINSFYWMYAHALMHWSWSHYKGYNVLLCARLYHHGEDPLTVCLLAVFLALAVLLPYQVTTAPHLTLASPQLAVVVRSTRLVKKVTKH